MWDNKNSIFAYICCLMIGAPLAYAQDMSYVHYVINQLCDSSMHGRGPEFAGEAKAASFIASEFKLMNLRSFGNSFFQHFKIRDVHTYPGGMYVALGGKQLLPGKEFICDVSTETIKGNYPIVRFDKELLANGKKYNAFIRADHSNEFIFADRKGVTDKGRQQLFYELLKNPFAAKGIILVEEDKLTYGRENVNPAAVAVIRVLRNALPLRPEKIDIDITCRIRRKYRSQNIAAYVEGTAFQDSSIVFTAHYDHIGRMGASTYFPGANDNASGVAMLLSLARYYSEHPQKYKMVFVACGAEEQMLKGSAYFSSHPLIQLSHIRFLINLDILGTGDEGIRVVNATVFPEIFHKLVQINNRNHYLSKVKKRGEAAISDHYPFYVKGVPCFYIYTLGGIKAYHDVYDKAETLPLTEFSDIYKLLVKFVQSF